MDTLAWWVNLVLGLIFIKETVEYLLAVYIGKYSNWRTEVIIHYSVECGGSRWGYITRLRRLRHIALFVVLGWLYTMDYHSAIWLYGIYLATLVITFNRFTTEVMFSKLWWELDDL